MVNVFMRIDLNGMVATVSHDGEKTHIDYECDGVVYHCIIPDGWSKCRICQFIIQDLMREE